MPWPIIPDGVVQCHPSYSTSPMCEAVPVALEIVVYPAAQPFGFANTCETVPVRFTLNGTSCSCITIVVPGAPPLIVDGPTVRPWHALAAIHIAATASR